MSNPREHRIFPGVTSQHHTRGGLVPRESESAQPLLALPVSRTVNNNIVYSKTFFGIKVVTVLLFTENEKTRLFFE